MSDTVKLHDAARLLDVSADTIRRWDKKGLIKSQRSELNHRVFDINEIERLQLKLNGDTNENNYKIFKSSPTEYKAIDLFAGAGGTALGLEHAGFQHEMLVEYDKNAAKTLRSNKSQWNVIEDDVANVNFSHLKGKVDLVEGGFPCQSFSYAGKKMGFKDVRGTLFFEFARCVDEVRPKIAIGENVRGLLRHDNGRTLQVMLSILKELGYRVGYKVLKSQYLDVPQKRERLIIMGVRNDLDYPLLFPREKNYTISMKEALENVPDSPGQQYPKKKKDILKMVSPGGYWRDLPIAIQKEYMGKSFYQGGGKTGMARRLSWEEPCLTLTCSPAQKQTERCHPEETRPLTVREYARIQTFPDNWEFAGSISQNYKQIGNAVPVNLGYHIGRAAIAMLSGEVDQEKFEEID